MTPEAKVAGDVLGLFGTLTIWAEALTPIFSVAVSVVTIAWFVLRILETSTVKRLLGKSDD